MMRTFVNSTLAISLSLVRGYCIRCA
jgi:hypothetical protein